MGESPIVQQGRGSRKGPPGRDRSDPEAVKGAGAGRAPLQGGGEGLGRWPRPGRRSAAARPPEGPEAVVGARRGLYRFSTPHSGPQPVNARRGPKTARGRCSQGRRGSFTPYYRASSCSKRAGRDDGMGSDVRGPARPGVGQGAGPPRRDIATLVPRGKTPRRPGGRQEVPSGLFPPPAFPRSSRDRRGCCVNPPSRKHRENKEGKRYLAVERSPAGGRGREH